MFVNHMLLSNSSLVFSQEPHAVVKQMARFVLNAVRFQMFGLN
jgi:hypothetical protein